MPPGNSVLSVARAFGIHLGLSKSAVSRKVVVGLRKDFSARDVISKWEGARVYSRQTSYCGAKFLEYLQGTYPYKIKAIQIDGGSEWKKDFEQACREKEILLFVLPPNSPKLNGCVERADRTHREEFYELEEIEYV